MRLVIQDDYERMSQWAAEHVIKKILLARPTEDRPFVLGLPTGSTPLGMYRYLVEANRQRRISFEHVITFNMDEYVGLSPTHPQSYHYFMWQNFFSHIDIQPQNVHILDGLAENLEQECLSYEAEIRQVGGIDFFIGGVGSDGHIAFNEPGSSLASRTRRVRLAPETIVDNSRFFENDLELVPQYALTVGIGTIMDAREVMILVNGRKKAPVLKEAVEGALSQACPITALHLHPESVVVADEDACDELRLKTYRFYHEQKF